MVTSKFPRVVQNVFVREVTDSETSGKRGTEGTVNVSNITKATKQKIKHADPAAALLKHNVSVSSTIRLLISNKIILKQKNWQLRLILPHPLRPTRGSM